MAIADSSIVTVPVTPEHATILAGELTFDLRMQHQQVGEKFGPMTRDEIESSLDLLIEIKTLLDVIRWGHLEETVEVAMTSRRARELRDYLYETGGQRIAFPTKDTNGLDATGTRELGQREVALADLLNEAIPA